MSTLLFEGADWDYEKIQHAYEAIEEIALNELGLDVYPNQIETITAEQMLDAYASNGLPLMYKHWSFGKHFAYHDLQYRKGAQGLAYEIVINSSPCIVHIMEENTMTMQALVMAHAGFGHNHFFKNNSLFRQWTDASSILSYLEYAKNYIATCEERYGADSVERLLDAAHALMPHGVDQYTRKAPLDLAKDAEREQERREYQRRTYNDLWRTVPQSKSTKSEQSVESRRKSMLRLPEENLLYFIEKRAPMLKPWQREVLRIVRNIAQYFYPQQQTQVMNEGCATMVHYTIMNRLHERGMISDGSLLEFIEGHTGVVYQPGFDSNHFSGINPYYLGFSMMQDIKRICEGPTDEDREWFPNFAGNGDPWKTLREAWVEYRDESFILQFLSPYLIRKMRLFHLVDVPTDPAYVVGHIHDERGYRGIRSALAHQYNLGYRKPDIQVVDVDLNGDRELYLQHNVVNGRLLDSDDAKAVLQHIATLWGYGVTLFEMTGASTLLNKHSVTAPK